MQASPPEHLRNAIRQFAIDGELQIIEPFQRGHIHDTYVSTWATGNARQRFLHQRINDHVFTDVAGLMHNIETVTRHLDSKNGPATGMRTLTLVPTRSGESHLLENNGAWRTYLFLENTESFDLCASEKHAFEAAQAFGQFQAQLFDLDVDLLRETIPNFFSSPYRLQQFDQALSRDPAARAQHAAKEIDFIQSRRDFVPIMENAIQNGRFPRRIVHGDTKLNNVLFDKSSGKAVCVVDLDTCMPSYSLYDFGDLVRFTAATSAEDEQDLTKAGTNLDLYRALVNGYLDSAGSFLTPYERELMPMAARLVTLTIGMRFLTDYLAGDVYFKVEHEQHNLDRARVQLCMVDFMEHHADAMKL